jgi:hypothetical protein
LVVIGSEGMVSLAALRWLADQDAAFVTLSCDLQISGNSCGFYHVLWLGRYAALVHAPLSIWSVR